jgi:hypothetical protein
VSRRGRLAFLAACLLAFALIAGFVVWSTSSTRPSRPSTVTVTLAPGANRPAGLTVTDLGDAGDLQARFNADKGSPRLLLALAPT